MPTKVVRIPLISDNELIDYKIVNQEMWKLQDDVRTAKNKTIQMLWEWGNYGHEYSKEKGIYPKAAEILPLDTIRGNINAYLKHEFSKMYSANLSTVLLTAEKEFKNSIKEVLQGTRSIIEYKGNQPIEIHNKSIILLFDEMTNSYGCKLRLFSSTYREKIGLSDSTLTFKMVIKENAQRSIVKRCFDGVYKVSASKLLYIKKKKQWFLNLSYTFVLEKSAMLDPEKIMGVDMGIVCVAAMSFNCNENRYFIDGGEISAFRHRIERQKRELQRQGKYCGEGRVGHGVKTRIKPLEKLNVTIANFRDTTNHKYSRFIVDMAIKHKCGTIQIEDLKEIAGDNKFLKEWTYFDLRTKIEYKAAEKGIKVIAINPINTSRRCSECGYIDKENRLEQEKFECLKCGYKANADYNASRNIAIKGIEKIIKESSANIEQP